MSSCCCIFFVYVVVYFACGCCCLLGLCVCARALASLMIRLLPSLLHSFLLVFRCACVYLDVDIRYITFHSIFGIINLLGDIPLFPVHVILFFISLFIFYLLFFRNLTSSSSPTFSPHIGVVAECVMDDGMSMRAISSSSNQREAEMTRYGKIWTTRGRGGTSRGEAQPLRLEERRYVWRVLAYLCEEHICREWLVRFL